MFGVFDCHFSSCFSTDVSERTFLVPGDVDGASADIGDPRGAAELDEEGGVWRPVARDESGAAEESEQAHEERLQSGQCSAVSTRKSCSAA